MNKIFAIISSLIIVALCFTSCGDDKTDKKKKASKSVSLSSEAKTDSSAASDTSKEVVLEKTEETKDTLKTEKKQEPQSEVKPQEQEPKQQAPAPTAQGKADVSLSDVRGKITNTLGVSDALMFDTAALTNLYGINASQVKQSAGYTAQSGVFPQEIIMVEAVDSSSADSIQQSLQNKLNEVLTQSQTYDAESYKVAQQCKVMRNGNYVALFISPDHAKINSVYSQYIK